MVGLRRYRAAVAHIVHAIRIVRQIEIDKEAFGSQFLFLQVYIPAACVAAHAIAQVSKGKQQRRFYFCDFVAEAQIPIYR